MNLSHHVFTLVLGFAGLIYMVCGLWQWRKPPKKINPLLGYRTRRSMKSQAAWDFAQAYSGRLLFYCGLALLLAGLLGWPLVATNGLHALLPSAVVLAFTAIPVYLTERKLKAKFDHR